jgi:hypothetical protein
MTSGDEDQPGSPTSQGEGQGGGMAGALNQGVQQVEQTEMMLTQLAQQFPATAPALRQAQKGLRSAAEALRAASRQVMTNPGQPEPPAPNIGG